MASKEIPKLASEIQEELPLDIEKNESSTERGDLARERLNKISGFFSGIKDGFINKASAIREKLVAADTKINNFVHKGVESGVNAAITIDQPIMNAVRGTRDWLKNDWDKTKARFFARRQTTSDKIESAKKWTGETAKSFSNSVSEGYNATVDMARGALTNAAERGVDAFGGMMYSLLEKRMPYLTQKHEAGSLEKEKYEKYVKTFELLGELRAA